MSRSLLNSLGGILSAGVAHCYAAGAIRTSASLEGGCWPYFARAARRAGRCLYAFNRRKPLNASCMAAAAPIEGAIEGERQYLTLRQTEVAPRSGTASAAVKLEGVCWLAFDDRHSQPPACHARMALPGPNARTGQSRDHGQALLGSQASARQSHTARPYRRRTGPGKDTAGQSECGSDRPGASRRQRTSRSIGV